MRKRILFIDNNALPSKVIPGILNRAGFQVDVAADLSTGINMLSANGYNVVILRDVPGAESCEPCQKIRSISNLPLIVINPSASAASCVRAINCGADYFLRKPFGPLELIARVGSLLQRNTALSGEPALRR